MFHQMVPPRSTVYVRQGPVPSFNRDKPVTKEEVQALKARKLQLLDEKDRLRAQISRIEIQTKRGGRPFSINQQLFDELDHQYRSLSQLIEDQNRQIAELNLSDTAALYRELQEEAKVIYQEQKRLEDACAHQQAALEESNAELEQLLKTDGPEALTVQIEKLAKLEAKYAKYTRANRRLKKKVTSLQTTKIREDVNADEIQHRAAELERQIAEVHAATAQNLEKYEQSQREHEEVIARLRKMNE
jgi:chromosome segregation ATPase